MSAQMTLDEKAIAGAEHFVPPATDFTRGGVHDHRLTQMYSLSKRQLRKRWKSGYGKTVLRAWRNANHSREKLEQLVGKLEGRLDIRGVPLRGASLRSLNLRMIDLYAADLRKADLTASDLTETHLSEADLRSANLGWVKFDKGTFWDNARVNLDTKLDGIDSAQMNRVHAGVLLKLIDQQNELAQLRSNNPVLAFVLRVTCRYGHSIGRWSIWSAAVAIVFTLAMWHWGLVLCTDGRQPSFLEVGYFAATTFASTGFGEYKPSPGIGQLVAAADAALGYVFFGIFIGIIGRKIIR
jgi:Pentapeptide repeats (8 copies)/Ion channel